MSGSNATGPPEGDRTGKRTPDAGPPQRTGRWWPVAFAVFGLFAFGLFTLEPTMIGLAIVGVVFGTYATVTVGDTGEGLELERSLSRPDPAPGEPVEVTVTLRNTGERLLPDLRFVDGVPGAMAVTAGSPRFATALRPGDEFEHTYEVTAVRGEHTFDDATVVVRSLGGARQRRVRLPAETSITCSPPLSDVPLRAQTSVFTGRIATDVGGTGTEFHSARTYRSGDPLKRIDWRRYARTGDLATVEFREERAATVVLLVDTRPAAYWTASLSDRHAVEHAVAAAGQVFGALVRNGDRVGIAAIGDGENIWLEPRAGQAALADARHFLAHHPAFRYDPPEELPELAIDPDHPQVDPTPIRSRLPDDAQVIAFSPLCDDGLVPALRHLEAVGHATTVVSPNVTRTDTLSTRLANVQRTNRAWTLRDAGIQVVDWDPETELTEQLIAESRQGRSR